MVERKDRGGARIQVILKQIDKKAAGQLCPVEMARISIALAVFNGANHLDEQLESYLTQTRQPDELVAVDDGSSDDTLQILRTFGSRCSFPVHVVSNSQNIGVRRSFDRAISECTGDIIFLSDHDDFWLPQKIETLGDLLENSDSAGLVFSDARMVDHELRDMGSTLFDRIFSEPLRSKFQAGRFMEVLLSRNVAGGATTAFRSKYVPIISPIPTNCSFLHDGWIATVIAMVSNIAYVDECLIKYRQHPKQRSRELWEEDQSRPRPGRIEACAEALSLCAERKKELEFFFQKCAEVKASTLTDETAWRKAYKSICDARSFTDDAIEHFHTRKSLGGLGRILPIAREVAIGRYHRFSNGFASAMRDLFDI